MTDQKLFKPSGGMEMSQESNAIQPAVRTGTEIAASRQAQEVQAAMVIAKRFPRDETAAITRIIKSCQRSRLAEAAEYEYARGGTKIVGPSVDLLRVIAKNWGNIQHGWHELSRGNGESTVFAYCWDLETNARSEVTFTVRHWRDTRSGGYAVKDEREVYELVANQAARRERACMEAIIDSDVVDLAVEECHKTLSSGHGEPLIDRVRKMVVAFADIGVSQEMLEKRLNHSVNSCSENQLAALRRIYKSIKDGVGKREDWFSVEQNGVRAQPAKPEAPSRNEGPAQDKPKRRRRKSPEFLPKEDRDEPTSPPENDETMQNAESADSTADQPANPPADIESDTESPLNYLIENEVTFDEFQSLLVAERLLKNADSLTSYDELTTDQWLDLAKSGTVAKAIRIYGKKG